MNNYYKYLRLPFENKLPSVAMQQYHIKLERQLIDPNFIAWLDSLDLAIGFSEIFQKGPGEQQPESLHIDGEVFDDHVKINFIVNPGSSVMRWWKIKPGKEYQKKVTKEDVHFVEEPVLLNGLNKILVFSTNNSLTLLDQVHYMQQVD